MAYYYSLLVALFPILGLVPAVTSCVVDTRSKVVVAIPRVPSKMPEITITGWRTRDVRFPTSLDKTGSDAMNAAGDYSSAYCILETDSEFTGHGMVRPLPSFSPLLILPLPLPELITT